MIYRVSTKDSAETGKHLFLPTTSLNEAKANADRMRAAFPDQHFGVVSIAEIYNTAWDAMRKANEEGFATIAGLIQPQAGDIPHKEAWPGSRQPLAETITLEDVEKAMGDSREAWKAGRSQA